MSDKSVITLYRRIKLTQITSGAIDKIPKITHMAFDSGGVDENGVPLMPSETQTELNNEICRYPVKPVEYPIPTTAEYTSIVPIGEQEAQKFNEFALVDAEGNLCAIKNTFTKQKDKDMAFTWVIKDQF